MSRARVYARNLSANWMGYGISLLVLFFLSPFIVHQLGDESYGVWSLMISLTGYMGLVELGTGVGLQRFINHYLGKKEIHNVNSVISTGLATYVIVGGGLMLVGGLVALLLPVMFPRIPENLIFTARMLALLVSVNLWLAFLSVPFRQIVQAFERFDLLNLVDLVLLLGRTVATIAVLIAGYDLIALAFVSLGCSLFAQICLQVLARRVFPELRVSPSLVTKARFRELLGFSIGAFVGNVGGRLLFKADNIVIAVLLGPVWVTFYTIGGQLLYKARDVVIQAAMVFSPQVIKCCARNDRTALQSVSLHAANISAGVGILLLVGLIGFGHEFITLWMGPNYAASYRVMAILAASSLFEVGFLVSGAIFTGLHRTKTIALFPLGQGLVNLALSITLVSVFDMGIESVAWGTFFPRVVFGVIEGALAFHLIGMSMWRFIGRFGVRWTLLALSFWGVCQGIQLLPVDSHWLSFFGRAIAATAVYLILAWAILLDPDERRWAVQAFRRRFSRNVTIPGPADVDLTQPDRTST